MKSLFDDAVITHVGLISKKFCDLPIHNGRITKLTNFYRKSSDNISAENMEKAIACIYALQTSGIPLKASSIELGIDIKDTLSIFKKLKDPSLNYVPLFMGLLKKKYTEDMKERFDEIFMKASPNVLDLFALATVIDMELTKSTSYYGYSEITIRRYKKIIRGELHG